MMIRGEVFLVRMCPGRRVVPFNEPARLQMGDGQESTARLKDRAGCVVSGVGKAHGGSLLQIGCPYAPAGWAPVGMITAIAIAMVTSKVT